MRQTDPLSVREVRALTADAYVQIDALLELRRALAQDP